MKIFIDLGAFTGDTLKIATKIFPSFDLFYGFEPYQPNFQRMAKDLKDNPKIKLFCQAAGTYDGKTKLFLHKEINERQSAAEGNTMIVEKNNIDPNNYLEVPVIDFSRFLKENTAVEDEIMLKIDIEGGEYDLLEKMIADGTIKRVRKIYCEWHQHKIPALTERHHRLINELKKLGFNLTGNNETDEFSRQFSN